MSRCIQLEVPIFMISHNTGLHGYIVTTMQLAEFGVIKYM